MRRTHITFKATMFKVNVTTHFFKYFYWAFFVLLTYSLNILYTGSIRDKIAIDFEVITLKVRVKTIFTGLSL